MKKLAGVMLATCFGILEGSDVQGYELHSSTMLLLLLCTVSAVAILYKSFKEDEHYGRFILVVMTVCIMFYGGLIWMLIR